MKNSHRFLRNAIILFTGSAILTGCNAFEPIRNAVLPNFSDEQLDNPMASFVPSDGATMVAPSSALRPGLAFSATAPVSGATQLGAPAPSTMADPLISAGLMAQAATSGVTRADAALLDAALDVSPSQMGEAGASMGLVAGSLTTSPRFDANGASGSGIADQIRAPIINSLKNDSAGFIVLSSADAAALMHDGGAVKYTALERADLETPYFDGRTDALRGLPRTPGYTAVGTSPAVALSAADDGPNSSGSLIEDEVLPRSTQLSNQAAIPIYGGSQRLAQRPTSGTYQSGFAQFRSKDIEFTLTYPTRVAVTNLYGVNSGAVTLTLRNLGSMPVTFQPENLLNRFPPFEVYRWTGSTWASLTLDVAYNLDQQGIAAPVVLQPGESTTRRETLAKLALLPLTVNLPPTQQLAIRLRVLRQGDAFGTVDSSYLPIQVTDAGAFPTATNLTTAADPGFVVLDGSEAIPSTIVTR